MASSEQQEQQEGPAKVAAQVASPHVTGAAQRHEIEPTVQYAIVPGPARDAFLFYHMEATSSDIHGLWDYCRFCVSNLVWVNDHFVVIPNPCYLNQGLDLEARFAKIIHVLLNWFSAKRLVASLDWPAGD